MANGVSVIVRVAVGVGVPGVSVAVAVAVRVGVRVEVGLLGSLASVGSIGPSSTMMPGVLGASDVGVGRLVGVPTPVLISQAEITGDNSARLTTSRIVEGQLRVMRADTGDPALCSFFIPHEYNISPAPASPCARWKLPATFARML